MITFVKVETENKNPRQHSGLLDTESVIMSSNSRFVGLNIDNDNVFLMGSQDFWVLPAKFVALQTYALISLLL